MSKRALSHSEVSSLLDCQQKYSFQYTGVLTNGDALKPRQTHVNLRAGRAWGEAVAEWHRTNGDHRLAAMTLVAALDADAKQMREAGWYDQAEHEALAEHLLACLEHYTATASLISLHTTEHEIRVPIPSRAGGRASTLYEFHGFLDGVATDQQGRDWIVEFKFRKQLSSLEQIQLGRQLRWYAWAWREQTGRPIAGILLDERLNAAPAPVRFNKDGSLSKVQSCTAQDYARAAHEGAAGYDMDVAAKLEAKRWHARHTIFLTDRDLDEAGWQMRSAARLVRELESGRMYPVRNPNPLRCPGCAFREICADRSDDLIDALFVRVPPKAARPDREAA